MITFHKKSPNGSSTRLQNRSSDRTKRVLPEKKKWRKAGHSFRWNRDWPWWFDRLNQSECKSRQLTQCIGASESITTNRLSALWKTPYEREFNFSLCQLVSGTKATIGRAVWFSFRHWPDNPWDTNKFFIDSDFWGLVNWCHFGPWFQELNPSSSECQPTALLVESSAFALSFRSRSPSFLPSTFPGSEKRRVKINQKFNLGLQWPYPAV